MLIHPTVDRLRALGLAAMADTLAELQNNPEAAGMPHADWLGLLVDREVTARDNRRLTRRLTSAKLRQAAAIENVDYRTARGLVRSSKPSPPANGSVMPTIWSSSAQPAPASPGLRVRSATRPAATASPCSTSGHPACSPISPRRAAKAVWRA
ncbi:hypothetical protein ACVIHI_008170 [Bradyrhizobium sp. USDA 4524]|nr:MULTISPECIES: ATP-binding protein [unclassified Bradyrhizobium]MCP1986412.1 hypothetical protein [Bradyrhizobium sp. USDA 4539]